MWTGGILLIAPFVRHKEPSTSFLQEIAERKLGRTSKATW